MDDIFNFKLHIKEIITPIMKNLGFKKTNLNFTRINGRYLEKIVLQKSQFNLAASEKTIFVNYYTYLKDDQSYWLTFNRLENKMKYAFYDSWSFFDENDLIKMLTFLGKLLNNYTNTFYEAMEKYLDTVPENSIDIKCSNNIEEKCSKIFKDIQQKIPEEEVLIFNLEKEKRLPPKIQYCACTDMLVSEYNLDSFPIEILNQGKELNGLKIVFSGEAIKKDFISIGRIVCCNYSKKVLFEVEENKINENEKDKYLIFSFDDLKMNPGYDESKLSELAKKDFFAFQRADKYHKFDVIRFHVYYKINKPEGKFQVSVCPNENYEEGQEGCIIEIRENEPTYEEVMEKCGITT